MKSIRIFTTGGTIDKVYFDATSEFEVGESLVDGIFKESQVTLDYEITSLMRKDSLEITAQDRALILDAVLNAQEDRIIITHGTDTMSDTAQTLIAGKVIDANKTIVLTGALNPARFRSTDAIFNVGMALAAVQSQKVGVYITMNGQVFEGDNVMKDATKRCFCTIKPDSK